MTDLPMMLCAKVVNRLMLALEHFATTADPSKVKAGIDRLNAYRSACKGGEKSAAEVTKSISKAREELQAWAEAS